MKAVLLKLGIHDRDSFFQFCRQFLKFGLVGVINTIASLAIYYLFIAINPSLYLVGNAAAFVVTVANAYFLGRRFVFDGAGESIWKGLLKSYLAYGGSFLLGMGLLYLQVEWLGVPEAVAPLINLVVTIPLNFLVNKFWTFG